MRAPRQGGGALKEAAHGYLDATLTLLPPTRTGGGAPTPPPVRFPLLCLWIPTPTPRMGHTHEGKDGLGAPGVQGRDGNTLGKRGERDGESLSCAPRLRGGRAGGAYGTLGL